MINPLDWIHPHPKDAQGNPLVAPNPVSPYMPSHLLVSTAIADSVAPKEGSHMAFSFGSIGHALASGLHDAYKGMVAVEQFIAKAATPQNIAIVTGLTSLIPGIGPQAATIERGVFAVAGQFAAILTNVTNGGEQKLLDAGFDAQVLADFKALIAATPGLVTGATSATVPPFPASPAQVVAAS